MDTIIDLFLWVARMNPWERTLFACVALVAWLGLGCLAARLLAGGYAGDSDDNEEDAR